MTCRELIDFIGAWLDGELAPEAQAVFAAHLAVCRSCEKYLDSYRKTVALGRSLGAPRSPCGPGGEDGPPPEDAPEELVQAVLAARSKA